MATTLREAKKQARLRGDRWLIWYSHTFHDGEGHVVASMNSITTPQQAQAMYGARKTNSSFSLVDMTAPEQHEYVISATVKGASKDDALRNIGMLGVGEPWKVTEKERA